MKTEKMRLTRIIKTLKGKIPEGDDLWGYPGISKSIVITSLEQSYTLIGLLDEFEDQMEVIWAKRELSKTFDNINRLIEEIDSEEWTNDFDVFLEQITKLRVLVKDIYITLTNNPIRIDTEIQKAKEQYRQLVELSADIETRISLIDNGAKALEAHNIEIEEQIQILKLNTDEAEKLKKKNQDNEKTIEELNERVKTIVPEIEMHQKTAKELKKEQEVAKEEAEKLLIKIKNDDTELKRIAEEIKNQIHIDDKLQNQIKQTLEDVNKHGMAASFLKRKEELKTTMALWGTLSVISMGILIFVSYIIASEMIKSVNFDPIRNLFKIPSVIAGVWLCWFSVKQYGYTSRIREDYSFKCAISMAFEGYKKETREVNEELLERLLQITIASIAINPVMLFDTKSNHGSPWNEWMDGVRKVLKIDAKADMKIDI